MEKTVASFTITIDGTDYEVTETIANLAARFYVTVLGQELVYEMNSDLGELRPVNNNTIDPDLISAIANEIESWCERQ